MKRYIWYIQKEPFVIGVQLGKHNILDYTEKIRVAVSEPSYLPNYGYGKNIECFLKIAIRRFIKYLNTKKWCLVKETLYKRSILCYDVLWYIEQYII